jgi:predicted nucleic acid-binding protein
MANGFATVERRGLLSRSLLDQSLDEIEALSRMAIDHKGIGSISVAFATATEFRLTAYDAAYLEIARREGLPLATLDRELIHAARQANVTLFA